MDLDGFKMKHADKGIPNVGFRLADITKTNIPPADCILLRRWVNTYWRNTMGYGLFYKSIALTRFPAMFRT